MSVDCMVVSASAGSGNTIRSGTTMIGSGSSTTQLTSVLNEGGGGMITSSGTTGCLGRGTSTSGRPLISVELIPTHAWLVSLLSTAVSFVTCTASGGSVRGSILEGSFGVKLTRFVCGLRGTCGFLGGGGGGFLGASRGGSTGVPSSGGGTGDGLFDFSCEGTASGDGDVGGGLDD